MLPHKFYQGAPNEDATTKHRGLLTAAGKKLLDHLINFSTHFRIETVGGYSFFTSSLFAHLCSNAYWDGTNWLRYDLAQPAAVIVPDGGVPGFSVYTAAAGANPIVWTINPVTAADLTKLPLLGTSNQSVRSTNVALPATTSTTLQSITLAAGIWQVQGYTLIAGSAVAGITVDVWLSGYSSSNSHTLYAAGATHTFVTPPATITSGGGLVVNMLGYSNGAVTSYGTGGVAGLGGTTGIIAVRVG